MSLINDTAVCLSGLVIMSLPLDPRFVGSDLAEIDGFLGVIKIHSRTSLRNEVRQGVGPMSYICDMRKDE
jgi:hypothetical protein